jgi:type IV fimbrial biogenesis protein FimT
MLNASAKRGVTLIELMVALVIVAALMKLAGPGFATWMQNTRIRTMAEGVMQGLHTARAEAVRRNSIVRFELMNNLTSGCVASASGANWVVSMDSAVGACNSANMADAGASAPRMIQSRSSTDGASNATVNATLAGGAAQTNVVFNGLGRIASTPTSDIWIDIANPTGGACAASSGPMRCLRIVVSAGGQARMCDPRPSFNGTTEGC